MENRFSRWPLPLCLVGLAIPLLDMILVGVLQYDFLLTPSRLALALAASVALSEFSRQRDAGLPDGWSPAPSWSYWGWMTVYLGVALAGLIVVAYGVVRLFGFELKIHMLAGHEIPEAFYRMCIDAPLVEEVIYRQALCGAVLTLTGPRWAIATSGVLFAALHWVYGNPCPENQVGGFILAWMYLRSGTLVIPILFHLVGNFAALWLQVLAYQVLGPKQIGWVL